MIDINKINKQITNETFLSLEMRQALDSWFKKQNDLIKNDVFINQKNEYFKLKAKYKSCTISLSAFYLAVYKLNNLEKQVKSKNKIQNMSLLEKTTEHLLKKNKKAKKNPKEELFLNHIGTIKQLIDENTSLRGIEAFFKKNYNKKISHSTISKCIKKYILKEN